MKFSGLYFSSACLVLASAPAYADVMFQCVDGSGHKSFSNMKSSVKGVQCTAMDLGPAAPIAAPIAAPAPRGAAKTPTPSTFPRVDNDAQKARDTDRRRILDNELAAEQRNAEQAKRELAEQEATILPNERMQFKGGGGIAGGKVEDRVRPYRDKVALHERNIEAIQKEIGRLR